MPANDTFEQLLIQLMSQHIPSKMLSENKVNIPWITKQIKAHLRKRNKLFSRQKVTWRPTSLSADQSNHPTTGAASLLELNRRPDRSR
ncbi:hypothetical protein DPMN_139723 [Dreissena polymorpha]|uniref:Uncharacterized protein n=1 Tax=Dreissena polymorpha TaxID=45954 RepID=A0A9D4G6E1_DREPO|nr:hypothetical protein DPMN_139723 [Dreissena polymorpha]